MKIQENLFDNSIKTGRAVVMFSFEEKCKSCNDMKPLFKKYEEENPNINCFEIGFPFTLPKKPESELVDKLGIETFPTFHVYENGQLLATFTGNTDISFFNIAFKPLNELKVEAYDLIEEIGSISKKEDKLTFIDMLIQVKKSPETSKPAGVIKKKLT